MKAAGIKPSQHKQEAKEYKEDPAKLEKLIGLGYDKQ